MHQVNKQTYEQKFDMYMDCKKEDIVRMLIEANKQIDNLSKLLFDDSSPSEETLEWAQEIIDNRKDA